MLHRNKPRIKAVFVDTLGYQGTLDTMVHLAETAAMDSQGTKVIKVSLEEKTSPLELDSMHSSYVLSFNFAIYNNINL